MFTKVQIIPGVSSGNLIQWTLTPDVEEGFSISVFRMMPDHSWSQIGAVKDTYFFVDTKFRPIPSFETVYKLVLNDSYDYVVRSFIGALPNSDRATIRSLRRRELLLQEKGGGRPGYLLKRRGSVPCDCDEAGRSSCDACYGSGFIGGYYKQVPYGMLSVNSSLNTTKRTSGVGVFSAEKEVTRGLVYPILEEGDVWVEKFTDRRYFITGKTELTYRGIPIVYSNITMSLVPALSKVYDIRISER